MNQIKKTMMILFLTVSAISLQGCGFSNWLDWLFAPCDNSCYSGGTGFDYEDETWNPLPEHDHPPRYVERPRNPERESEIEEARRRERRDRDARRNPNSAIENATTKLMVRYELSSQSASTLASHLIALHTGHTHQLSELGISQDDLNKMSQGQNPSAFALKTMAHVLNLELDETHELIQKIKMDLSSGQF